MKVIAYTDKDGNCCIVYPNYKRRLDSETDADVLARLKAKDVPEDAQNVTEIEDTDLPYNGWNDETKTRSPAIRSSWVNPPDTTSPPVVDMAKARQLKMDLEWRPRRDALLSSLDVDYQRADEAADNQRKSAIARDKQKLRDMPVQYKKTIEAIQTPEELDNFNPVIDIINSMESV